MVKKIVIGVCGLVFVAALSFPVFADQSIGFQEYFNKGVKAFKEHDDQEALRCFKLAQIYDPKDEDLNQYLDILEKRGVVLELRPSRLPPEKSIGYRYYFSGGVRAFQQYDDKKAIRYFKIAKIFYPGSKEAERYLRILYQRQGIGFLPESQLPPEQVNGTQLPVQAQTVAETPEVPAEQAVAQPQAVAEVPAAQAVAQPQAVAETPEAPAEQAVAQPQAVAEVPAVQAVAQPQAVAETPEIPAVQAVAQPQAVAQAQPVPVTVVSQPAPFYVEAQKAKGPPPTIMLDQITNNGQLKPKLEIDLNSFVILQGKNIRRFLVVQEGFIGVKTIDTDSIEIDALRIGTTFLHVWDNDGRHTFYVEVVFPKYIPPGVPQAVENGVYHSQPFRFTYANDWDTYYSGKNIPDLKRQSYEFTETLGVTGETPYGFFDASGSYIDFNTFSEFDTYTIGLSQIPIEGTSNFDLRGFDAWRYLSPLTMPGTRLRGVFADVDLMHDVLGLSVSHGQVQQPLGFLAVNSAQFTNSYVDAAKLTLFPKSTTDQYSFNYATGYGPDHLSYLSEHVYSVEGHHAFNDYLTLNAEQGSDSSHQSTLASFNWKDGAFKSDLGFRDIDKNYSTISTLPAYQGEIGTAWTTSGDFKNFTEDTFVETYRDRLDPNPNDPSAYNYDANGQLRANITPNFWSDTDLNFVDTPGEQSPTSSFGINERLSRSFGIWNSLKGTVFAGPGYENSHSSGSDISDYDREDVIAGIQLPLTNQISSYANYEYDWLHQPDFGDSNPSIINTGLQYQRQISSKLSFNVQADYHDELGVKSGDDTFLSGEQSVILTTGFNYNPMPDVNFFADGSASKVLFHVNNPSYDDFEIHLGVRITFGGQMYWDPLGTVSGIVFKDRNGDGKFVPGDEGVPDVKVKVGDKEAITDKNGRYRIQIRAKAVDVVPVLDTIPGGLLFSTPQALNVRVFQGRTSHADFGLISQTGIYGIVFLSKNGSRVPNDGDQFVGKVRVTLDGKIKEKSDLHGAFYFRNVSPGQHTISIDINSLPLNMVPLIKLENKIDVTEGTNYMFNIPVKIEKAENEDK